MKLNDIDVIFTDNVSDNMKGKIKRLCKRNNRGQKNKIKKIISKS